MPNAFDDASKATEQMFVEDAQTEWPAENVHTGETTQTEESPAEEQLTAEQTMLNEATHTAETAAQIAAQKDAALQQALQQVEALQQKNTQLESTISEMSKQKEEQIIEEALEPPTLDTNALAFADEETVRQAQAKYAADMAEFTRSQIMKDMEPYLAYAKQGMYEKEKQEILKGLSSFPELQGIKELMPQIENIIARNEWLSDEKMPIQDKIINAYAIARGVNSINTPPPEHKEPTPEELLEIYNNNPAFQELVEKQRLDAIKKSQQVPPLTASSGAVNAALDIPDKPKTFEDASRRTREMFGMR